MIRVDGVLVSPGKKPLYGERMLGGCRVWDPFRSKLAALVLLGTAPDISRETVVLYLGAAHGTTVSHVADYAACVYAVEYAPGPMAHLLDVAERMQNVIPILADASRPGSYSAFLEKADLLYQDVAQPGQAGILLENLVFLKLGSPFVLMLKTRCVRTGSDPALVCEEVIGELSENGCIIDSINWLDPWHRDHAAIVGRCPPRSSR
jgi:fibrillarin-like pre-rRNA processing protein